MEINFTYPWLLIFIPFIFIIFFILWKREGEKTLDTKVFGISGNKKVLSKVLIIRLLIVILLIIGVANPSISKTSNNTSVIFLVDTSDSNQYNFNTIKTTIDKALRTQKNGTEKSAIISIAKTAKLETTMDGRIWNIDFNKTNLDGSATNLAAGIQLAQTLFPENTKKQIVLFSDGNETIGNVNSIAQDLLAQNISLDIWETSDYNYPEILLEKVLAPKRIKEGELVNLTTIIQSNIEAESTLSVNIDGETITSKTFLAKPGVNSIPINFITKKSGQQIITINIQSLRDTFVQNNTLNTTIIFEGPPLIAVVSTKENSSNLSNSLKSKGFNINYINPSSFPSSVGDGLQYDSFILSDISVENLTLRQQQTIETLVKNHGRGLTIIGGNKSLSAGGYANSLFETMLPVSSKLPKSSSEKPILLVILIDKSQSMQKQSREDTSNQWGIGETKLTMAKIATKGAIESLFEDDQVGVIAFDQNVEWIIPIQVINKNINENILNEISKITASGGTNFAIAIAEAATAIPANISIPKNFVLLTDGFSLPGDFENLIKKLKEKEIVISNIAIGAGADVKLLQYLSDSTQGRFYFTETLRSIPKIMVTETQVIAERTFHTTETTPIIKRDNPFINANGNIPKIDGYVRTVPKKYSTTIIENNNKEPLLTYWQYGLGKIIVWTSDSEGIWTNNFLKWENEADFWANIINWTIPHSANNKTDNNLVVTELDNIAKISLNTTSEINKFQASITTPSLTNLSPKIEQESVNQFTGEFPITETGIYHISVYNDKEKYQTILNISYPKEYKNLSTNKDFLNNLSIISNGKLTSDIRDIFRTDISTENTLTDLRWLFIVLALILIPVELILRRIESK